MGDLAAAVGIVPALVVVSLVAYVPGWLVAFLAASLLLDRQPPVREAHPSVPVTVLIAAPQRGRTDRGDDRLHGVGPGGLDHPEVAGADQPTRLDGRRVRVSSPERSQVVLAADALAEALADLSLSSRRRSLSESHTKSESTSRSSDGTSSWSGNRREAGSSAPRSPVIGGTA